MSHEAQHSNISHQQPATSFNSALWFVLVLAILFICAVNFVSAMSDNHEAKATHTEASTSRESGSEH